MSDNPTIIAVAQPVADDLRSDIIQLWKEEGAEFTDIDRRLAQVTFVAKHAGKLVGVTTAVLIREPLTRQHLFSFRVIVTQAWRQNLLAYSLIAHSLEAKEDAFLAGEELHAVGVVLEIEAPFAVNRTTFKATETQQFPVNKTPKRFDFIGFDNRGVRKYVYYFKGAKLSLDEPEVPAVEKRRKSAQETATLALEFVENNISQVLSEQIIALWLSSGVITSREACLDRLPQVCAIAKHLDDVVAVASVFPVEIPQLRASMLIFRSFVSANARGAKTATELVNLTFNTYARRFAKGEDSRYPGMMWSLQNASLNKSVLGLVSPLTQSFLLGWDDNNCQLRCRYFDDAMVTIASEPVHKAQSPH